MCEKHENKKEHNVIIIFISNEKKNV